MDITIKDCSFTMKVANGISENMDIENGLADVQKRLSLIYPQQHELKVNREPEMLTVVLNVQLAESDFKPVVENENPLLTEPAMH
jgi:LytS/YehU family sensor histidine kinase